jgi:hypothetical protein
VHGFNGVRSFHGHGLRARPFAGARFAGARVGAHNAGLGRLGAHHVAAAGFAGAAAARGLGLHGNLLHGASAFGHFRRGPAFGNAFANRLIWNRWGWRWNNWRNVWFGATFWPFLYGDLLSYAFWPYDYYDPFWDYDLGLVLGATLSPGVAAAPSGFYNVYGDLPSGGHRARLAADSDKASGAIAAQACVALAPGVADLPIDRIEQAVHPSEDQLALLNDLKNASSQAGAALKTSCPEEVPLTPTARIDAIEQRFKAVDRLLKVVQAPLERFYDALSEEQKRQFDAIATRTQTRNNTALCDQRAAAFSNLPLERIEQIVRPTEEQKTLLNGLTSASSRASTELRASCPAETPQTLADRLSAIDLRIAALLKATQLVRPALEGFYASLNDEQKARLMAMRYPVNQARQD